MGYNIRGNENGYLLMLMRDALNDNNLIYGGFYAKHSSS